MAIKNYVTCLLSECPDLFKGYYQNYSIEEKILERLSKDLGFSYDMYTTLNALDSSIAERLVVSMSKRSNHEEINLLIDEESYSVLGYSLDTRVPILNDDFMKRVTSLVETSSEISIVEKYCVSDDTVASVIIRKSTPIIVDTVTTQCPYDIGVLVVNNELDNTYCRLVVFIDDQPVYLPASYYNTTTNRYRKSTGSAVEALEVLILRVIDDLREEELKYKINDFHLKYRVNKDILATYEEYNTLLRSMMKLPSVVDDRSVLESLSAKYDDFEKKYTHLDDQKSSYIFRCTAIGDLTIGSLIHMTSAILSDLGAPAMEYFSIRELLGNYLSTNRIAIEIAKEV